MFIQCHAKLIKFFHVPLESFIIIIILAVVIIIVSELLHLLVRKLHYKTHLQLDHLGGGKGLIIS